MNGFDGLVPGNATAERPTRTAGIVQGKHFISVRLRMADVWAALDFARHDWLIVRISRSTAQLSASLSVDCCEIGIGSGVRVPLFPAHTLRQVALPLSLVILHSCHLS